MICFTWGPRFIPGKDYAFIFSSILWLSVHAFDGYVSESSLWLIRDSSRIFTLIFNGEIRKRITPGTTMAVKSSFVSVVRSVHWLILFITCSSFVLFSRVQNADLLKVLVCPGPGNKACTQTTPESEWQVRNFRPVIKHFRFFCCLETRLFGTKTQHMWLNRIANCPRGLLAICFFWN